MDVVQTSLRIPVSDYERLRSAAKARRKSLNAFVLEAAIEAASSHEKQFSRKQLNTNSKPYMIPSLPYTREEIESDPRLSQILSV